jgi:hypothetical protein
MGRGSFQLKNQRRKAAPVLFMRRDQRVQAAFCIGSVTQPFVLRWHNASYRRAPGCARLGIRSRIVALSSHPSLTMSRFIHLEFPNALYHVTARGDRRKDIFDDNTDRHALPDILAQVVEQINRLCYA